VQTLRPLVELSRLFRPSRCDCSKVSRVNLLPSELWRGRPQFTVSFYGCQACFIVVRQTLHLSGCALRVTMQAKRKRAFSVPLWHSYLMLTSWYAIAGRVLPSACGHDIHLNFEDMAQLQGRHEVRLPGRSRDMWLALMRRRTVRHRARFSGPEKALCAVQVPRLVCLSLATRLMPPSCQADKSGLIDLLDRHLSCSCGYPWSASGVKRDESESCTSQPANITLGFPWLIFNSHSIEGDNELMGMQKYLPSRLHQRRSLKYQSKCVPRSQDHQSQLHQRLFPLGASTGTAQGWLFWVRPGPAPQTLP
jgi:hypothetical protein